MIITICVAVLLARIKHFHLRYVFSAWSIYPFLISQCVLLYAQFCVFRGQYTFIPYAGIIKSVCLFTLILPIIFLKLYKQALYGSGLIITGTLMNKYVMSQNGGQMPVFPTLSYLTGYVKPDTFQKALDSVHVIGDANTHIKFLSDYIDVGFSILSPGDVLIHCFTLVIVYHIIKVVHLKRHEKA